MRFLSHCHPVPGPVFFFKNKTALKRVLFCILKHISDGVPLFLAEERFQHVADGLFQQGIRLPAHPDNVSASACNQVRIDHFSLVVIKVKADFDAVGAERPSSQAVFPVQNLRNDHVIAVLQIFIPDIFDCDRSHDCRNTLAVSFQFFGQCRDDFDTGCGIIDVSVPSYFGRDD